jgi:ribosome biogenesis GTPase / thiamine phosphate phosphatase
MQDPSSQTRTDLDKTDGIKPVFRVSGITRTHSLVTDGYTTYKAVLKGRMLDSDDRLSKPVTGDIVCGTLHDDLFVISEIKPRRSLLERKSSGKTSDLQAIAANVDMVLIVIDINRITNPHMLERYLSVVHGSGAEPVVVISKADLKDDPELTMDIVKAIHGNVRTVLSSHVREPFYDEVEALLAPDMTVVLVGPSGSGKSTLSNHIMKREHQSTSEVDDIGEGRHTTTSSRLWETPFKGYLIDTPGMREVLLDKADLGTTFDDITSLSKDCRFKDCTHTHEPGCAVRKAIEEGTLESTRLSSYQRLLREQIAHEKRRLVKERQASKTRKR